MEFIVQGHNYIYEVQTTIQIFYPNEKYTLVKESNNENDLIILSRIQENMHTCYAAVFEYGKIMVEKTLKILDNNEKEIKRNIKLTIYNCLSNYTNKIMPWGIMTGIRPSKRVHMFLNQGFSNSEIREKFKKDYLVSDKKINLMMEIAHSEKKIINNYTYVDNNKISIYVGIPFCPTKCSYCSFTSFPIKKYFDKSHDYVDALIKELEFIQKYCDNRHIESFYIGGGTPTSLNEYQLEKLLNYISINFNILDSSEFTVEAGRPDTINSNKLQILKRYGVTRISINPQTMKQKTLDIIGRQHTIDDFLRAYYLSNELGFKNINIDLILGLPDENIKDVENTMEKIFSLNPVSLTIHTLAIKRATELKLNIQNYNLPKPYELNNMIDLAYKYCLKNDLNPYYIYRQKNSTGNFENVGYSKSGFECIYNTQIMSDQHTILATGAGASTKIVNNKTDTNEIIIERIFNVKDVDEYINKIDKMIERKLEGVVLV